ncbi:MAG: GumC family protein, partial [Oscillospiraceae bacterium]
MNKPFEPPGSSGPQMFPGYDPYAMQMLLPPERSLVDVARDATPELIEIWRGLMLRKWMILGITVLITAITVFVLMRMTPIYQGTATVLIEQNKGNVVSIDQVYGAISSSREYYTTQAEFLKSHDVALRVIRKLALASHPEFDPRQQPAPFWREWLPAGDSQPEPTESVIERRVLGAFGSRLNVEPVRNSQLVQVSFESADPVLAASIANETAHAYINADMDARFSMTQQANVWLTGRLTELKQNLDASERALQAYRESEGIADTKGLAQGGQSKHIEELTQRLVEVRIVRTQAEEALRGVQGQGAGRYNAPAVINNAAVSTARQSEAAAEQKFAEIRQKYGPAFPTYKQAEQELEAARGNARRAADAVIASMEKEFRAARAAESALDDSLARARGGVQQTNRKEIALSNYEREVETNRQLYETFLARVKETDAAGDIQTAVARVVDPALPALLPVKPKKFRIALLALLGSLLGASMVAILLNRLDNTIKTTDGIEEKFGLPLLGALPKLTKEQERNAARLMLVEPQSAFSEGVRTISTGVLLSTLDEPHKV